MNNPVAHGPRRRLGGGLVRRLMNRQGRPYRWPVGWLFGRELIDTLKPMLLSGLIGGKWDLRDWMRGNTIPLATASPDDTEFWFDYLADTGDGQTAVYSIAYLCQRDLWAASKREDEEEDGDAEVARNRRVRLQAKPGDTHLPRGRFLFVGGDTAYHMADYATLFERVQAPFNWAYDDLTVDIGAPPDRRWIFGIPGNHDYYDLLDGFNRQMRRPYEGDAAPAGVHNGPQLTLNGFMRSQEASYVDLQLPFGWHLWGLDTEQGIIDRRQAAFFSPNGQAPDKLIVATPEPSTVFGKYASRDGRKAAMIKTFEKLGLEPSFIRGGDPPAGGRCRLDLSGDVHHYARHWGEPGQRATRRNYASVVSGMGGAFVHPSYTDAGEITPNVLYPAKEVAAAAVIRNLFQPWFLFRGGYVWLVGALLAMLLVFAALVPTSTRSFAEDVLHLRLPPAGELWGATAALAQPQTGALHWDEIGIVALFLGLSAAFLGLGQRACRRAAFARDHWWWYAPLAAMPLLLALPLVWLKAPEDATRLPSLLNAVFLVSIAGAAVWALGMLEVFDRACFRQTRRYRVANRAQWVRGFYDQLVWFFLLGAGLGDLCLAFWRYGQDPLATVFTNVLALAAVGLLVALVVAARITSEGVANSSERVILFALGAWHALLEAVVPFALALYVSWIAAVAVLAVCVVATSAIAVVLPRITPLLRKPRWVGVLLASLWLVLGAGVLVSLYVLRLPDESLAKLNMPQLVWAGFLGACFPLVWFGWYFGTASFFNGHNNEAGGASRIERYKQFIRFRLTQDVLTGYVIAVDEPQTEGSRLTPRVIDEFTVRV